MCGGNKVVHMCYICCSLIHFNVLKNLLRSFEMEGVHVFTYSHLNFINTCDVSILVGCMHV